MTQRKTASPTPRNLVGEAPRSMILRGSWLHAASYCARQPPLPHSPPLPPTSSLISGKLHSFHFCQQGHWCLPNVPEINDDGDGGFPSVLRSRSRLELQFWSGSGADLLAGRSREPAPLFYGGTYSCWIFRKAKKTSLALLMCTVNMKPVQLPVWRDNMIQKWFLLTMKFYRAEMKNLESGVRVTWNCPFLPGARVGSGTLYVRSRPNKWRLCNTALNRVKTVSWNFTFLQRDWIVK